MESAPTDSLTGRGQRVPKGVRNAAPLDNFLGGLTPKTASILLRQHGPELGFTLQEFHDQRAIYGSVLTALSNITGDRRPQGPGSCRSAPHTTVPGQIIHVDLKQVGGIKGRQEMLILHGVCQLTNY